MDVKLKLIIEELNKIESVKGKLKYLEGIIFKTKDKSLKEKLIRLLELIQKSGKKRLSFEEIHSNEKSKVKSKPLEEMVLHRGESFDESKLELKDYIVEPGEEVVRVTPVNLLEEENLDKTYLKLDTYKLAEKKDYIPQEVDTGYERRTLESVGFEEEFRPLGPAGEVRGMEFEPAFGMEEQKPLVEATMGEYKRNEIISKAVDEMKKKEEEYKRKLEKGIF
ncbi:MAG: hypothetical protein J7K73_02445 [Nanoarchaeota archaeon]|nr:hypothetical protein [Nanoarchaeota archaeon]